MSKNPIKDLIFVALQDSFSSSVTFHKIDEDNSVIEMDYDRITKAILKSLAKDGYKIVPKWYNVSMQTLEEKCAYCDKPATYTDLGKNKDGKYSVIDVCKFHVKKYAP